jgi:2-(1,2-epoxy-1,2-dihydrophenyl)acetyl-CoA isomerase
MESDLRAQLANEENLQALAANTEDFVEGVSAFLEKRPAQFRGR